MNPQWGAVYRTRQVVQAVKVTNSKGTLRNCQRPGNRGGVPTNVTGSLGRILGRKGTLVKKVVKTKSRPVDSNVPMLVLISGTW